LAANQYSDDQTERAQRPLLDAYQSSLAKGDFQGAQKLLDENEFLKEGSLAWEMQKARDAATERKRSGIRFDNEQADRGFMLEERARTTKQREQTEMIGKLATEMLGQHDTEAEGRQAMVNKLTELGVKGADLFAGVTQYSEMFRSTNKMTEADALEFEAYSGAVQEQVARQIADEQAKVAREKELRPFGKVYSFADPEKLSEATGLDYAKDIAPDDPIDSREQAYEVVEEFKKAKGEIPKTIPFGAVIKEAIARAGTIDAWGFDDIVNKALLKEKLNEVYLEALQDPANREAVTALEQELRDKERAAQDAARQAILAKRQTYLDRYKLPKPTPPR
jgi:hypothetical protein